MPESKNNAWLHGAARFQAFRFPTELDGLEGLFPMPVIINLDVGQEVVLFLKDTTPFINTIAKTRPFKLRVHGGVGRNQFGCLGFFVFWIPSPFNDRVPLAIYDTYVNLRDEGMLGTWRELAFQTHWHVLLLDRKSEQCGFFEFRNTFRIHEFLNDMEEYCRGIPVQDFDKTKAQFMEEKSVEDLFHDGPSLSTLSEGGLSVFDNRFAIPHAPDRSDPLRAARFMAVFRESCGRHAGIDQVPGAKYFENKLQTLRSGMAEKRVIYLDLCHWINLRHVWLQSRMALPVYELIVDRLNRLAEQKRVVCPLSVPIFEELMKQLDPRSRAATANLMDIFSQGVSLMRFEEAFAEQCFRALNGKKHDLEAKNSSLSKIGLWFTDDRVKSAWWSPDISEAWENISIDLRWELTVCDAQKLLTQGAVPRAEKKKFFAKWTDLPVRQKAKPKQFWELAKECRNDVVSDCAAEAISQMQAIVNVDQRDEIRENIIKFTKSMIESRDYGQIPCCEVLAAMCAARIHGGGKVRPNDIFDFLHASAGIPSSEAYFCDSPMEHLVRSKELRLDQHFNVTVRSKPEKLLDYLETISEHSQTRTEDGKEMNF